MEDRETTAGGHYEEFGVESVAPDDDFGYWVTYKKLERERKRRSEIGGGSHTGDDN